MGPAKDIDNRINFQYFLVQIDRLDICKSFRFFLEVHTFLYHSEYVGENTWSTIISINCQRFPWPYIHQILQAKS